MGLPALRAGLFGRKLVLLGCQRQSMWKQEAEQVLTGLDHTLGLRGVTCRLCQLIWPSCKERSMCESAGLGLPFSLFCLLNVCLSIGCLQDFRMEVEVTENILCSFCSWAIIITENSLSCLGDSCCWKAWELLKEGGAGEGEGVVGDQQKEEEDNDYKDDNNDAAIKEEETHGRELRQWLGCWAPEIQESRI